MPLSSFSLPFAGSAAGPASEPAPEPDAEAVSETAVRAALADIFGFDEFRPHQEAIVRAILAGRDSFTVMPTGGGKSLCYQLPARLLPGVCVVISPLLSLMKDQVDAARAGGLAAATLNSSTPWPEVRDIRDALDRGELDLLYVSPERLNRPEFQESLRRLRLGFFAVDEAHCISEWGHDFRPDYLELAALKQLFPQTPVAAFTATATNKVAGDIISRLRLRNPFLTRASFNRPNLHYAARPKEDLPRQLVAALAAWPEESGIIYRATRKDAETTAALLQKHGINCRAYHAGLSSEERAAAQEDFRHDRCRVIAATVAFGMGIDKSNVRFVIHGDLPKNLESYYQETGRAGRDGAAASCLLFHGKQDAAKTLHLIRQIEDPVQQEAARKRFYEVLSFARAGSCRRKILLRYFGESLAGGNCGGCDLCTGDIRRVNATIDAQKALSAMVRTGGGFGFAHLAGILTGSTRRSILEHGHDKLPTYGVGRDKDRGHWRAIIESLIAQGLACIEGAATADDDDAKLVSEPASEPAAEGGAGARGERISVTPPAWEVLRGKREFFIQQAVEEESRPPDIAGRTRAEKRTAGQSDGRAEKTAAEAPERCEGLFQALRAERTRLAETHRVPPYVIFSDAALDDMARHVPTSTLLLLGVNGVGKHKLQSYGQRILAAIEVFFREHPDERPAVEDLRARHSLLEARAGRKAASGGSGASAGDRSGGGTRGGADDGGDGGMPPQTPDGQGDGVPAKGGFSPTVLLTLSLWKQGLDAAGVSRERGLAPATIAQHLEQLAQAGSLPDPGRLAPPERLELWRAAFEQHGSATLTPAARQIAGEGNEPDSALFLEGRLARLALSLAYTTTQRD